MELCVYVCPPHQSLDSKHVRQELSKACWQIWGRQTCGASQIPTSSSGATRVQTRTPVCSQRATISGPVGCFVDPAIAPPSVGSGGSLRNKDEFELIVHRITSATKRFGSSPPTLKTCQEAAGFRIRIAPSFICFLFYF